MPTSRTVKKVTEQSQISHQQTLQEKIIDAAEAKMKADAPLGQKRPKYDEAVLQNLEGDRQTE